jgi:hypothetical protein
LIRSYTAYTNEIDDVDGAVAEILEQLGLAEEGRLLRHSVGVITCFAEYLESGVVKALCERLPFDVVGATTVINSSCGEIGEAMLALMVLTSDDVLFSTSVSEPLSGEEEAPLRACYEAAAAALPGKPVLMLSFLPLLASIGGDYYVERMTDISGGVLNFGTIAVDHNEDYHDSRVTRNGDSWTDRLAVVLMYGEVAPSFFIGTISNDKVFREKGVVTASRSNQLHTVNGIPIIEYLKSLGLPQNEDGTISGANSFPLIVDSNDGTLPAVRTMFAFTPEGYAVCGGIIPEGSTLSIGSFSPQEIVGTTSRTLEETLRAGEYQALLMYSCIGRYFAQGYETTAEMEQVQKWVAQAGTPYFAAYSGGELCPVRGAEGRWVNRSHGNSFIICAL